VSPNDARQPPAEVVRKMVEHLAPGSRYWPRLEAPFRRLLVDLPSDTALDNDGEQVYGRTALPTWLGVVRRAAWQAFGETTNSLDTSARGLKAVARAEREFERRLNGIIAVRDGVTNTEVEGTAMTGGAGA